MIELCHKYRPRKFQDVIGQDEATSSLRKKCKKNTIPHAILFFGPAGTGKTTLARIVSKQLNCGKYGLKELNTADYRGIDSIRAIRDTINQAPIDGDVTVYLFDECAKLTGDAQNALLKMLEEPPDHAYFILCTTEPEKLLDTIRQRCTLKIRLKPVENEEIENRLTFICKEEKLKISEKVIAKIAECSEGSVREAIQRLDDIKELEDEEEMMNIIEKASLKAQVIEIARLLLNKNTSWKDMAKLLKNLEKEDPESIRYMILGYAKAVILNSGSPRAYQMLEVFSDNFYDSKMAGVVKACYELLS